MPIEFDFLEIKKWASEGCQFQTAELLSTAGSIII